MKIHNSTLLIFLLLFSCNKQTEKQEQQKTEPDTKITEYQYFDIAPPNTASQPALIAVTGEEYLEFGSSVAYVSETGDTVIPYGKFAYFGTDTLKYYANVMEEAQAENSGRKIAIDRNQNVLFEIFMFDNGPDYFEEGLMRVIRNGKMGFANKYGQVVIPCIYDFVRPFADGKAEVTMEAKRISEPDGHTSIESDAWFFIDREGEKIE